MKLQISARTFPGVPHFKTIHVVLRDMISKEIFKRSAPVLACVIPGIPTAHAVTFDIADPVEFSRIIDTSALITTHATINSWLEGPTWIPSNGGYLVFCDQGNNRLKKLVPPSTVTDFLIPPANTLFNGTVLDGQERLICAEAGSAGQKVAMVANNVITPLVTTCNGLKFYSPNDVAVKSDGTTWFTDPNYNSNTMKGAIGYPAGYHVYRFDPSNGNTTCTPVMTNNFGRTDGDPRPNGLCFSPDETRLYVADSDNTTGGHRIYAYSVSSTNTLTNRVVFANVNNGVPDGIKCDIEGRVWSSAGNGVHIFAPDGHVIGRIITNRTANVCFGGPQYKTLYMTGQPYVTSIPVLVSGTPAMKKLRITTGNGQLILSWPSPSTGWSLQESEHLETPESWTDSSLPIITTDNRKSVIVDTSSRAKFFRLKLN